MPIFLPQIHSDVSEVQKSIGLECLPKEYGGTIPMAEMIGE